MNRHLSMRDRIAVWIDLMRTIERFQEAGFRMRFGDNVDIQQKHRDSYMQWLEEHDAAIRKMCGGLKKR